MLDHRRTRCSIPTDSRVVAPAVLRTSCSPCFQVPIQASQATTFFGHLNLTLSDWPSKSHESPLSHEVVTLFPIDVFINCLCYDDNISFRCPVLRMSYSRTWCLTRLRSRKTVRRSCVPSLLVKLLISSFSTVACSEFFPRPLIDSSHQPYSVRITCACTPSYLSQHTLSLSSAPAITAICLSTGLAYLLAYRRPGLLVVLVGRTIPVPLCAVMLVRPLPRNHLMPRFFATSPSPLTVFENLYFCFSTHNSFRHPFYCDPYAIFSHFVYILFL